MRLEDRLDRTTAFRWGAQSGRGRLRVAHIPTQGAGMYAPPANGTLYWRDQWGRVLAESDLSGNQLYVYVYFAGRMLSRVSSTEYLAYADALGSTRTMTDATGHLCYDAAFYPFGGERAYTSTCGQNYKFAGMERDPETGDDHTLFRQYASNYGRWLSPDPADLAAADPANPQSWNRYTYALNNPLNLIDPRGLDSCILMGEDDQCQIEGASWNGGPLPGQPGSGMTPSQAAVAAANNWLNQNTGAHDPVTGNLVPGTGFSNSSCSPSGGLSQSCNAGYQGGGEFSIGFAQVVFQMQQDYRIDMLNQFLSMNNMPDDFWIGIRVEDNIWHDYLAIKSLEWWSSVPSSPASSVPHPSVPCSQAIGSIISPWNQQLQAWIEAHPGQTPPASVATPPSVNGAC
jgi:RHS repeat-associated protein